MRIRVEVDENILENEVIIRCNQLSSDIMALQQVLNNVLIQAKQIPFYKGDTEFFLALSDILFFETEGSTINAHTTSDVYQVKFKLYELEELLPHYFMRVSKSTILNINRIYSITKNITSSSTVEFNGTHKQVFVSRLYYKPLKIKLLEKR